MLVEEKTLRVVIADDHAILRQGLRQLLEDEGFDVVGEAADGQEAIERVMELHPDVVLLDVSMPGLGGIQAAQKLTVLCPETKVVMLTVHQVEEYIAEALKAGARGYVLKDAAAAEVIEAIRVAHRGETYLSPSVSRLVVDLGRPEEVRTLSQRLTSREREVCRMLALGNTVPEIAEILGISRKTVDVHKTRLMKKLDLHNRAELVRYAIQNRMVEV